MEMQDLQGFSESWPEEETCRRVYALPEKTKARALLMAIHVMELTLKCRSCPKDGECSRSGLECEGHVLDELLERSEAHDHEEH